MDFKETRYNLIELWDSCIDGQENQREKKPWKTWEGYNKKWRQKTNMETQNYLPEVLDLS